MKELEHMTVAIHNYMDPTKTTPGLPYIYILFLKNTNTNAECVYVGQSRTEYTSKSHIAKMWLKHGCTRMRSHMTTDGTLIDVDTAQVAIKLKEYGRTVADWKCYLVEMHSPDNTADIYRVEYAAWRYLVNCGLDVINNPTASEPGNDVIFDSFKCDCCGRDTPDNSKSHGYRSITVLGIKRDLLNEWKICNSCRNQARYNKSFGSGDCNDQTRQEKLLHMAGISYVIVDDLICPIL